MRHSLDVRSRSYDWEPGVPARGEVAEDGAVEAVLGFGHEVEHVVRQEVVVADRSAPEIGMAISSDLDGIAPRTHLDEGDLQRAPLTKSAYFRPSKVVAPRGMNCSFSRRCSAAALSGPVIAVMRSKPAANAAWTTASEASVP